MAECEALEAKIDAEYPELSEEFFDVVWGGSSAIGAAMFLEGWKLRGNVDEVFNLPDAQ
jgi:hypothetical protein